MTVQAMGYFWVGTSKLDDWTSFATGQLGLQAVDRGGATHAFRMDDRKQRLIVDGGLTDGERFFGWEVADATALDDPRTTDTPANASSRAEPRTPAGDRRQLRAHERRLSLVGCGETALVKRVEFTQVGRAKGGQ